MHLGSLYTAAASYLDARAHHGQWLVRIEDLDLARVVPGSAARILSTLEHFGFQWSGEVVRQSARSALYDAALDSLQQRGLVFECSCSRSELAEEEVYPGTCRQGPHRGSTTALRVRVEPSMIQFSDRVQGTFRQNIATGVGDFVVRRRDRLIAYVLAVVVDDADQNVTHVVRGADLLDNTPRQIYLQRLLGIHEPKYAHVPLLLEPDGKKLAKSMRSIALDGQFARRQLMSVFELLGLPTGGAPHASSLEELWRWATQNWDWARVPRRMSCKLSA